MSVLLFKLNGVPEDEAEAIRTRLDEQEITYYETSAGNWGVSLAAIWLNDEARLGEAQAVIEGYQLERAKQSRADYDALRSRGEVMGFWASLAANPWRSFLYLWPAALILYISLTWFIGAWNG